MHNNIDCERLRDAVAKVERETYFLELKKHLGIANELINKIIGSGERLESLKNEIEKY